MPARQQSSTVLSFHLVSPCQLALCSNILQGRKIMSVLKSPTVDEGVCLRHSTAGDDPLALWPRSHKGLRTVAAIGYWGKV